MYKFLQEDLEALKQKRDLLAQEMKEQGEEMAEATRQSSETWHDNAPFDVARDKFDRLQQRHYELGRIISNATVIKANKSANDRVAIGSEVTFIDQQNRERTVRIGSYMPREGSDAISYEAPVAKLLMGHKVGDATEGVVVDREVVYEITRIKRWI